MTFLFQVLKAELSMVTPKSWRRDVVVSAVRRMNEVNPRWTQSVCGWVTVFRRVYHLGM